MSRCSCMFGHYPYFCCTKSHHGGESCQVANFGCLWYLIPAGAFSRTGWPSNVLGGRGCLVRSVDVVQQADGFVFPEQKLGRAEGEICDWDVVDVSSMTTIYSMSVSSMTTMYSMWDQWLRSTRCQFYDYDVLDVSSMTTMYSMSVLWLRCTRCQFYDYDVLDVSSMTTIYSSSMTTIYSHFRLVRTRLTRNFGLHARKPLVQNQIALTHILNGFG